MNEGKTGREWFKDRYDSALNKGLPSVKRMQAALEFVELLESAGGLALLSYEPPVPTQRATKQSSMVAGELIMPFGKHRGQKLKSIPTSYLQWLKEKAQPPLLQSVLDVLAGRDDQPGEFDFEKAPTLHHNRDYDKQPFPPYKEPEVDPYNPDMGDIPF